uniref:Uncharacterized protein n=1 Tax=Arundo donax TaxID=35708 RepID=A0A0A8Z5K5_ARUDO
MFTADAPCVHLKTVKLSQNRSNHCSRSSEVSNRLPSGWHINNSPSWYIDCMHGLPLIPSFPCPAPCYIHDVHTVKQ